MRRDNVRLVHTGRIDERHGRLALVTHAKARTDLGVGMVEAQTSAFGIEFTEGGLFKQRQVMIDAGAFQSSIDAHPVRPIMYEHEWGLAPIGRSVEETETEHGLRMLGRLFVGGGERGYSRDLAEAVYESMLPDENGNAALDEWSIGFYGLDGFEEDRATEEEPEAEPLFHYTEIDRREHSVVLAGANPGTETITVNSSGVVLDRHGEGLMPCTMPTEFVVAGRRYVPLAGSHALPAGAPRLPDVLTIAGIPYRAVDLAAAVEELQVDEAEEHEELAAPARAVDPRFDKYLHRPAVRELLRPRRGA